MEARIAYEAIDTRRAFHWFAWTAWVAGFILSAWGTLIFHVTGYQEMAILRVAGAAIIAAGFFAVSFRDVDDAAVRRAGMLNFAKGFAIVAAVLFLQQRAVLESYLAGGAALVLLGIAALFALLWAQADVDPKVEGRVFLQTLFGRPAPRRETVRSRYERRIREAAGQEERHRLARDLHDSVKQQIFAIQASAATAQARFAADPAGASAALDQVRQSAREAMAEMEVMLDQLRAAPLEQGGLVSALKSQCEALGFRTGARVEFELGDLPGDLVIAPGAPQAIFRAAQEALSNVARHARATEVCLRLGVVGGWLKLTVFDNGAGFDTNQPRRGMGLANMRARAEEFGGLFGIESRPGATEVTMAIPAGDAPGLKDARRSAVITGLLFVLSLFETVKRGQSVVFTIVFFFLFARALMVWYAHRSRSVAVR